MFPVKCGTGSYYRAAITVAIIDIVIKYFKEKNGYIIKYL